MDWHRAVAIVLRRQPVTESSLLVTWFSREFGKLKTMAKGARRPKSPFAGKIDLFYRDEIVFLPSRRSDLHLLHDCFLEEPHVRLRTSLPTLTAASYGCELVELISEVEDPQPAIFAMLDELLTGLADRPDAHVILLWFELRLLAASGWKPKWTGEAGTTRVLRSLAEATPAGAQRVRLTAAQLAAAQATVWHIWDAEVGRAPQSRRLLRGG